METRVRAQQSDSDREEPDAEEAGLALPARRSHRRQEKNKTTGSVSISPRTPSEPPKLRSGISKSTHGGQGQVPGQDRRRETARSPGRRGGAQTARGAGQGTAGPRRGCP